MADPFEVRIKFTSQLEHLNASVNSAQKAANFAIKHRDMDEDLHSCILEQLEKTSTSMNNRANIMFFIEVLCNMAQREEHLEVVKMIQRDLMRIIDSVAPADGSGAANVKVVRRVLGGMQQKGTLTPVLVQDVENCLKERDVVAAHPALSPTTASDPSRPLSPNGSIAKSNGIARQDKRQIEQRIEEDRERHKRMRESLWAVDPDDRKEFEALWDDTSDIGEDDFMAAEEDAAERRRAAEDADCL